MKEIKNPISNKQMAKALKGPMRKQRDGFYSATINGEVVRDLAPIGSKYWFEYHCYEGWDSSDVEAWMHSHQQVEVIGVSECEGLCFRTLAERADAADVFCYKVRFADGVEWAVFEDELCVDPKDFCRPDPPARNQKLIDQVFTVTNTFLYRGMSDGQPLH